MNWLQIQKADGKGELWLEQSVKRHNYITLILCTDSNITDFTQYV